ncbi:DUF6580 family putative transport protein [Pedobacter ureilyticus]|uniref:DUF6580 family putative transport protein n=1 Tax=Pedobacter ureilyticus TaxID=1393051 RepID=A0ABW9J9E8_9SPHI|nr:DUF6580 family putative transport protein [Pedobacter helvus]
MSHIKFNPRTLVLMVVILAIMLMRVLIVFNTEALSFANFSSVGAVALFGGAYFSNNIKAYSFPVLSLFITDILFANTIYKSYSNGFLYDGWYWTYAAIILMVVVGKYLLKNITLTNGALAAIGVTVVHWLVSDIGVWYNNPSFTQDLAGYWNCLVLAIPFEFRFLAGTVIYGGVMFGSFQLLKVKYPALQRKEILSA